ncbi:11034fa2-dbab-4599-99f6-18ab07357156 [Thermothielavioides terrestris]|uniref:11034fa2-dbab-4599-99f6-18ab07357156 n=1 Tax=Thermothielavioides terrestris TaxID=2587410 RepID=A0A3S4BAS9_9PEZI|nr:11034fa2-dbab-4599-99f6-18ab07357156 [Thermothielavioides terrestris]
MRLLATVLSLVALLGAGPGGALAASAAGAAKKSAEERFQLYHGKALSSAPIKLGDASYRELTAVPRDYAVAVLLTAMDSRYGCQLCREFQPEWDLLARSWTHGDKKGESRIVYATLDFTDGRDIFMSLGLQTAPVLYFFPPTVGPHAPASPEPIRYDFTGGAQAAEQVHSWIARHLPDRPHPPIRRPINWMRWIVTLVALSGGLTVSYVAWPYVLPVIQNRTVWAAVTLISILLFTSGHMFNHIRNVPYVAPDGRGGISYFAGGFQNQYGLETQIVAAIYGILALSGITLAIKVPRISDPKTQAVALFAWASVLFIVYSFLLSVFRRKNGGYPFSLPPFM